MHISSPSSKKSATRPARSSVWLSSSFSPVTVTSAQNSASSSRMAMAFAKPSLVRSMPQYSQRIEPSSLWKESTVRRPLIDSSRSIRWRTASTASTTAGWVSPTVSNGPDAR